ncbi:MAG: hypothetical protein RIR09_3162 [Pseudomonadota bacterium]
MRIKKSFWAFLGRELPQTPEVVAECIRKAMLLALAVHCGDQTNPINVKIKIKLARGIYELWYLRPDLMHTLSVSAGEFVARDVLTHITAAFKGYHPLAGHQRISAPQH